MGKGELYGGGIVEQYVKGEIVQVGVGFEVDIDVDLVDFDQQCGEEYVEY